MLLIRPLILNILKRNIATGTWATERTPRQPDYVIISHRTVADDETVLSYLWKVRMSCCEICRCNGPPLCQAESIVQRAWTSLQLHKINPCEDSPHYAQGRNTISECFSIVHVFRCAAVKDSDSLQIVYKISLISVVSHKCVSFFILFVVFGIYWYVFSSCMLSLSGPLQSILEPRRVVSGLDTPFSEFLVSRWEVLLCRAAQGDAFPTRDHRWGCCNDIFFSFVGGNARLDQSS